MRAFSPFLKMTYNLSSGEHSTGQTRYYGYQAHLGPPQASMPYFSQKAECSLPPRSSVRSTRLLYRSPINEVISSPEMPFGTASLSSALLQSGLEPIVRGACFAAVGRGHSPRKAPRSAQAHLLSLASGYQ
jgi:hypothetical protein